MRDRDEVGSTFIRAIQKFDNQIKAGGNKLMLAGIGPQVMEQLERTGLLHQIGKENVYMGEP